MSMSAAIDEPKAVEALFEQALALCQAGRFAEAESAFRRILEIAPGHCEALHFLGMVCSRLGNHTEALRHIDAALQINAEAPAVHSSRGNVLAALKRLDEALASFDRAIALDPHAPMVFSNRGNAQLELRQFEEAVASYEEAIALDPDDAEACYGRGSALQQLVRLDEALAGYERAIAIRPDYAEAFNNRGVTLQELERFDEALASYQKAIAIRPGFPEALNNCGSALQAAKRFEEALASYDRAIALKPDFAEAWSNRGAALRELKRFDQALASYAKAIALRPQHAEAHVELGKLLVTLGRLEHAIAHFEKALAIDPRNAEAHTQLAYLIDVPGRFEEAVTHCEQALAIEPDNAKARNALGGVLRALGRVDEAINAFERAIACDPRQTAAYWNLVCSKNLGAADPPFLAMNELARDMASLEVEQQVYLHFALGKAFADIGEHQRSIGHLLQGNSLKRQQVVYDERRTLQWFERIRTIFTAELMSRKQGLGDPCSAPVFIVGMPRSGSTLIEQILASHPKVFGAGELREIVLMAKLGDRYMSEFPEIVPTLSGEQLHEFGTSYVQIMRDQAPAAAKITDKMLINFAYAGLIHLALPNARIIHSRRDPLDTGFSCFSHLFAGAQNHTYDLAELGRYYRAYETLMRHWRSVLPDGVMLEVRYEEVVGNLEEQARRILAHCGLEWDDACLAFYKTKRPVRTASHTQVRQPIYRRSVGRWREYGDLLQPFVKALAGS
jgi:tetratricopeptide (TPR) repeat protein